MSPGASIQSRVPKPSRAPICAVNISNNVGQSQHENWALKDKSRINISIIPWFGQGFFFKFISFHNWGKDSGLQYSDYWQMYLCILNPPPILSTIWSSVLISPLLSHKFSLKKFVPYMPLNFFLKKEAPQ